MEMELRWFIKADGTRVLQTPVQISSNTYQWTNIPIEFEGMVPMPKTVNIFNGGQKCDMLIGHCSCGAYHHFDNLTPELKDEYYKIYRNN